MGLEIERKFKLDKVPLTLKILSKKKVVQGYIAIVGNGAEVRVRKIGNKYFQTVKSQGKLVRNEIEIQLSENQFTKLWTLTKGKRITKNRLTTTLDNNLVEIDVYTGKLRGLIIAEIEFKSRSQSEKFMPPKWLGKEVTNNNKFKNNALAI